MVEFKEAGLVRSLAGHDKDELYIILGVGPEYVSLSDGKKHPVNKPKRKNKKHLQRIDQCDETIGKKLTQGETVTDEEIRSFICTHRQ